MTPAVSANNKTYHPAAELINQPGREVIDLLREMGQPNTAQIQRASELADITSNQLSVAYSALEDQGTRLPLLHRGLAKAFGVLSAVKPIKNILSKIPEKGGSETPLIKQIVVEGTGLITVGLTAKAVGTLALGAIGSPLVAAGLAIGAAGVAYHHSDKINGAISAVVDQAGNALGTAYDGLKAAKNWFSRI